MEPSQHNQKKDEIPIEKQPNQNAVIYLPKLTKKKVGKGLSSINQVIKKGRPIIFAALVSTLFATIAFTVIDLERVDQAALTEQTNPVAAEAGSAGEMVKIPELTMWVVQAGVFKEAASAETNFRSIIEKMPVIQTSNEDFIALWVGAASEESSAVAIAEKHQSEEVPLYIKQVSNGGAELQISEKDAEWLKSATDFTQSILAQNQNTEALDKLISSPPESELLQELFTSFTTLAEKAGGSEADQERASLQAVEMLWELPQKNEIDQ
ncbi:hypothetical protein [Jeotgalibacillus campisalis]|uniref:SPOR domain-containing protein n=1 Tax=Jeotgalibacillus campisalis TaxID=220754 RepID=A0A0C2VQB1_9BACL|nr:hypothetical protein [Jeotgalibacillus campisalis]KIL46203.1 hypothetical protein KR50_28780 [Jeotgalibacillus campisalis]